MTMLTQCDRCKRTEPRTGDGADTDVTVIRVSDVVCRKYELCAVCGNQLIEFLKSDPREQ